MWFSKAFTVLLLACLVASLFTDVEAKKKKKGKKPSTPNILYLLIDDLGYNDIGYHDSSISTPTLDKLASEGMILENNYVAPVCTPSRGALLTGKYSFNNGQQHGVLFTDSKECLTNKHPIMPETMKELGYATYMLGKWHEGYCNKNCTPNHRGFDDFYGFYNGYISHFTHSIDDYYDWHHNDEVDWDTYGEFAANILGDRAVKHIKHHHKKDRSTPFYMYFAFPTVHMPLEAPGEYIKMYEDEPDFNRRMVKAMLTATDDVINQVVNALKKYKMYDNTVILMSSDNGGENGYSSNAPLRGSKGSSFEGGVRVPGFVHSPLMKGSAGKVSKELFHETDWYPTIVSLAGGKPADYLDGYDQTDFLFHGGKSARTVVPIHLDNEPMALYGAGTIRSGKWKLVKGFPGLFDGYDSIKEGPEALHLTHMGDSLMKRDASDMSVDKRGHYSFDWAAIAAYSVKVKDSILLFDLEADPTETTDVSAANPDIVDEMLALLKPYSDNAAPIASPERSPDTANANNYGGAWSPGWC